jgi:hypothetical protein
MDGSVKTVPDDLSQHGIECRFTEGMPGLLRRPLRVFTGVAATHLAGTARCPCIESAGVPKLELIWVTSVIAVSIGVTADIPACRG